MDVVTAKARITSAEAAYERAKNLDGDMETIHETASVLWGAHAQYSIMLANEAADSLIEAGTDPLPRDALIGELEDAINSRLEFGEEVIRSLEEAQRKYGRFSRWECKARAADGSWRAMSGKAFDRAIEVLSMYCPRRSDNGLLAPPYRIKLDSTGTVVPE